MTVTFFGHGDAPQQIFADVKMVLKNLIEEEGACNFYVGNHGNFDCIVQNVLNELRVDYPYIRCFLVLSYMPQSPEKGRKRILETILPYEVATALPRFAISKRNEWMLAHSDTVVTYVKRSFGGAEKYKRMAIGKGKRVIELANA